VEISAIDDARTADASTGTGAWPTVPPVPTPTPPPPAQLGPEPPVIINRDVHLIPPPGSGGAPADPFEPPTAPFPPVATSTPLFTRPWPATLSRPLGSRAAIALRVRPRWRPIVVPSRADNQVWLPRFAYTAAVVVAVAFGVVTLPLWLALYRMVGTPDARLSDVVALSMMLLGGFLTAATAWVVIVEMRARVRMVDALGRTGEHEAAGGSTAFAGLLRPFIQVPGQVALLAVALCLFVGATLISLQ